MQDMSTWNNFLGFGRNRDTPDKFYHVFCVVYIKNVSEIKSLLWKFNVQSVFYFEKFPEMLFKINRIVSDI